MHEIKDEPILGNQSLFNGAPEDAVCVIKTNDGNKYFFSENDSKAFGIYLCFAGQLEISMRRVIRTPVWTKADQLAGKLPEVGSMLNHKTQGECTFIGTGVDNKSYWALKLKNDLIYIADKNWCAPIELPEEKASRLREEWCSKALDSAGILSEMKRYELKRLGEYIGSIHDALQSGDLPVPVKGE